MMHEYFEIESPPKDDEQHSTKTRTTLAFLFVSLLVFVSFMGLSTNSSSHASNHVETQMNNQQHNPIEVTEDQTRRVVTCGSVESGTVTNGAQVYFTLVAPDISSGSVTISTCNSPLDTWLYVYQGSQTTNRMWDCDDCGGCGTQSRQTFSLSSQPSPIMTRRQTYTIGVGSYGGSSGSFTLRVTCGMTCGSIAKGSIAPNRRLPINFVVPASGRVTLSTCPSNFNTFLYVYSGSTATYSCDDCGTCSNRASQQFVVGTGTAVPGGSGTNGLTAGSTVRVEVGGSGSASGNVELRVACVAGPTTRRPTSAPLPVGSAPPGCPGVRVRKSWFDSTQAERNLYLNGFKALRANGKLRIFTDEHDEAGWLGVDNLEYHGNGAFLPWHRYFIWELESQIRALGGVYSCFTLPYWDWTRTAGQPVASNPMFSQGLGGNGVAPSNCVQDGEFRQGVYQLSSTNGCLEREFVGGVSNYNTIQSAMLAVERVQTFTDFRNELEGWHDNAHVSIGGTLSFVSTATDDPIFFMLHAFVDLLWAMRSDCHNYGNEASPNNYPNPAEVMSYPVLRRHAWARANGRSFTAASFLRMGDLQYTYDASNMRARSGLTMGACSWDSIRHRPVTGLVKEDHASHESEDQPYNSYGSDARKARRACMRMQRREVRKGYRKQICRYTEPLEKCPPGKGRLHISLAELLNKRGVKGNPCIEKIRRENFKFAKQVGTLRGLCNGKSDPVC